MSTFNPLAGSAFSSVEWTPDNEDYRVLITSVRLSKWEYNEMTNVKLVVAGRIVSDDPQSANKKLTQEIQLGDIDPETNEFNSPDFMKVAQIFHAAFGYDNTPAEDERFLQERDGLDLSMDLADMKLTGSGWDELVGCEYMTTVATKPGKNGRVNVYFNHIRKVS